MINLRNIREWKTTVLGVSAFAVGLWQFSENNTSITFSMVVLGALLVLSPDKIIDALIEKIKTK